MISQTRFSFLLAGPSIAVSLPSGFVQTPELSSPVVSGIGARSFTFTPLPASQGLAAALLAAATPVSVLTAKDGRSVQVLRRTADPLLWWLVWRLSGGVVTTHLREEDGIERADTVVGSLSIDESGPTPFLFMDPPLRSGVSSFPGYQESAMSSSGNGLAITLIRPGYLSPGVEVTLSDSGWNGVRVGVQGGIELQAISTQGLQSAQDLAAAVSASMQLS